MDLSTIDDIKELKSLAYDQLVAKEVAERNLQAVNQRLAQLEESVPAIQQVENNELPTKKPEK